MMHAKYLIIIVSLIYIHHHHVRGIPVEEDEAVRSDYKNNDIIDSKSSFDPEPCLYDSDCAENYQCRKRVCKLQKERITQKGNMKDTYERKPKWPTFLISIFVGSLGIDWFYLARGSTVYIVAGVCKLLTSCGCCCSIFTMCSKKSEGAAACFVCLGRLLGVANGIWWLVDWIRILCNAFPDGNGVALA